VREEMEGGDEIEEETEGGEGRGRLTVDVKLATGAEEG
jgi:hypothetical protein